MQIGACTLQRRDIFIVLEYCDLGSLKKYLSKARHAFLDEFRPLPSIQVSREEKLIRLYSVAIIIAILVQVDRRSSLQSSGYVPVEFVLSGSPAPLPCGGPQCRDSDYVTSSRSTASRITSNTRLSVDSQVRSEDSRLSSD